MLSCCCQDAPRPAHAPSFDRLRGIAFSLRIILSQTSGIGEEYVRKPPRGRDHDPRGRLQLEQGIVAGNPISGLALRGAGRTRPPPALPARPGEAPRVRGIRGIRGCPQDFSGALHQHQSPLQQRESRKIPRFPRIPRPPIRCCRSLHAAKWENGSARRWLPSPVSAEPASSRFPPAEPVSTPGGPGQAFPAIVRVNWHDHDHGAAGAPSHCERFLRSVLGATGLRWGTGFGLWLACCPTRLAPPAGSDKRGHGDGET
jgi:hypothetical protein